MRRPICLLLALAALLQLANAYRAESGADLALHLASGLGLAFAAVLARPHRPRTRARRFRLFRKVRRRG
ncbi:hypothetical protein [Actinoplanes sp. NPDC089786]|uniref:hypothetical protein n=1 Tax=Actinoplanes sp. NPDC089786 TaxID=3155185 RepID=UPI003446273D